MNNDNRKYVRLNFQTYLILLIVMAGYLIFSIVNKRIPEAVGCVFSILICVRGLVITYKQRKKK